MMCFLLKTTLGNKVERANPLGGFTLLEILVVLLVMGILTAFAIPSWLSFSRSWVLNHTQDRLFYILKETRRNAIRENMNWQASFREHNGVVQWASHRVDVPPAPHQWSSFDPSVQIDFQETTLLKRAGVWRVQFNHRGHAHGQLGRLTLRSKFGGKQRRCIFVSTLIGTIRTAKENPKPHRDNRYWCY